MANLQSLEFLLRGFLYESSPRRPDALPSGTDWYAFPVGADVPIDEFTNWDTLRDLILGFNAQTAMRDGPTLDDGPLVDLRDALAHGRVSSPTPHGEMRLLKFSKPRRNSTRVRVVYNQAMTKEWFDDQMRPVKGAILTVLSAAPNAELE